MASISYKNMPITAAGQTIYASSASISQDISVEAQESLGVRGKSRAYNNAAPKGQVSFDYYEDGTFSVFENLTDAQILVIGPYTVTHAYLTSLNFNGEPNAPISMSQSWDFYGTLTEGAPPSSASASIETYVVNGLSGFDEMGGGQAFSFGYNSSNAYEVRHLLASVTPIGVFKGAEISLDFEGDELTNALTSSDSNICITAQEGLKLVMRNSCNAAETITITVEGHMTSRSVDSAPGDINKYSLNVVKYL